MNHGTYVNIEMSHGSQICMIYGAHINESRHKCIHINKSRHIYEKRQLICESWSPYINESWHILNESRHVCMYTSELWHIYES